MTVQHEAAGRNTIEPAARILVGEEDVARLCSTSRPTVRGWVAAGLLSPVEAPNDAGEPLRRNLFRLSDVQRFAERLAARDNSAAAGGIVSPAASIAGTAATGKP